MESVIFDTLELPLSIGGRRPLRGTWHQGFRAHVDGLASRQELRSRLNYVTIRGHLTTFGYQLGLFFRSGAGRASTFNNRAIGGERAQQQDVQRCARRLPVLCESVNTMTKLFSRSILISVLTISGGLSAEDLSTYRNFQFGTDLATVAKQAGEDAAQVTVIHARPVLMQELAWRPQLTGPSSQTEAAKDVIFSFYDAQLFRITVEYDRYEIDGLTADDLISAISAKYGRATKPAVAVDSAAVSYGDHEQVVAQWQDSQYRFELIRFSYGSDFKLVGVSKKLEAPAQAAILESARLDAADAPQREAARIAKGAETEQARLDKARLANKAKFKP